MSTLSPILIITAILIGSNASAKTSPLVSSTEEISFFSKEEVPVIKLHKTKQFSGVLSRLSEAQPEKSNWDLYEFGSQFDKINPAHCTRLLESVFGPLKKISLKMKQMEIFKNSRNQNLCEVTLLDSDKKALFKEHRFYALILDEITMGLVSRLNKPASEPDIGELRKFVKGLYPSTKK